MTNIEQGNGDNIFYLDRLDKVSGYHEAGTDYTEYMTPHVTETLIRLGLDSGFEDMLESHLKNLHLVFFDSTENSPSFPPVVLTVLKSPDSETEYLRYLLVSRQEIEGRIDFLQQIMAQHDLFHPPLGSNEGMEHESDRSNATGLRLINGEKEQFQKLQGVVLDWIFYEQSMVVASNACYMQQHHPNYIADFNGQSRYYQAEKSISTNYAQQNPDEGINVSEDSRNLVSGFGINMLHESMLTHGLLSNTKDADRITESLRLIVPEAHRHEEISKRLKALAPRRHVGREYALFALALGAQETDS